MLTHQKTMSNNNWKNANKQDINFNSLLTITSEHIDKKGKIIIGTDSMLTNKKFIFVNAICLVGKESPYHGRYFYNRYVDNNEKNKNLLVRLFKETSDSIELANQIKEKNKLAKIEIHMDVNPSSKFLSGKYSSAIIGYITGVGFDYKIKPNAYAASAVADRHTRPTSSYIKKHYK